MRVAGLARSLPPQPQMLTCTVKVPRPPAPPRRDSGEEAFVVFQSWGRRDAPPPQPHSISGTGQPHTSPQ